MRIGFIRHFPVEEALPRGWRTSAELMRWRERYDGELRVMRNFDALSASTPESSRSILAGSCWFGSDLRPHSYRSFQVRTCRQHSPMMCKAVITTSPKDCAYGTSPEISSDVADQQ